MRHRRTRQCSIRWLRDAPQFPAKAKRVIHLFMNGGPSQVDTFDPKPMLDKYAGKELPLTCKRNGALARLPFALQVQPAGQERYSGQ